MDFLLCDLSVSILCPLEGRSCLFLADFPKSPLYSGCSTSCHFRHGKYFPVVTSINFVDVVFHYIEIVVLMCILSSTFSPVACAFEVLSKKSFCILKSHSMFYSKFTWFPFNLPGVIIIYMWWKVGLQLICSLFC